MLEGCLLSQARAPLDIGHDEEFLGGADSQPMHYQ
jgi:hypothetical protein